MPQPWKTTASIFTSSRFTGSLSTFARIFSSFWGCFSELYGEELFNYLRINQDNHELRKRFVLALDNGDCVFDCSLREPFNSRLIIEKIKKRWSELEMSARNFASHFARKAFNDLAEYDFVKAKHADRLQDLLDSL